MLPAAACGDGVVEGYEECDGAADGACPSACSDLCACPATGPGDLEVHVIDVGQGDGVLIVSPDGFAMLVDAGTNAQDATVASYMASIGLNSLDYVLVTHMDSDHVGGMDGVLTDYPEVVVAFDNGSDPGTLSVSDYDAAAGDRRATLSTGQLIDMGPSLTVEALHTQAGASLENNNSNVIKLTYGANSVLVGGDCETECESSFDPGATQVYKVHHHGAGDSSSAAFLAQMQPEVALISVGNGNPYDHPSPETLDRLDAVGATVYRTDLDGDLEVLLDGTSWTVNGEAACVDAAVEACGSTDVGECSFGTRTCSAATSTALQLAQVAYDTPGTDSVEEFVDLYNPTGGDVALDGWTLADGAGTWTFPAGTTIAAGAFFTVARDAAGLEAWVAVVPDIDGLSLSLNNGGDVLVLSDDQGAEVDRVYWESYDPAWSLTAGTGDSLIRTVPDIDTDSSADWSTRSPALPDGGTDSTGGSTCGDGVCDAGEDCETCSADCAGQTSGRPALRYCCGNGSCESVGEDSGTCAVDCG